MKGPLALTGSLRIRHLVGVLAALFFGGLIHCQTPKFEWVKLVTPTDGEYRLKALTVDAEGHAVVASQLWRRSDSGIVASTWLSNRVTKIDSAGNILWTYNLLPNIGRAWTMGGLATDAAGRTYVAGSLCRGFSFPLQPLLPQDYLTRVGITAEGSGGGYVARISPSGELEWLRCFGGAPAIQAQRVAVDPEGNYYAAGAYSATAIKIDDLSLPAPVPTSARNLFLVKFSPEGRARWAKTVVGVASYADFDHLIVDADQTVRATLWKGDPDLPCRVDGIEVSPEHAQVTFDREGIVVAISPIAHSAYPSQEDGSFLGTGRLSDLTLTRYRPNTEIQWQWAPEPAVIQAQWRDVAVNVEGSYILAGSFRPQTWPEAERLPSGELVVGDTTLTTIAESELVLAKVSRQGALQWVTQSMGQHSEYDFWIAYDQGDASLPRSSTGVDGLAIGVDGAVWVTGEIRGSVRFDENRIEGPQGVYKGLIEVGKPSAIYLARIVEQFSLPPSLQWERTGNELRLWWPASASSLVLERATSLSADAWLPVTGAVVIDGDFRVMRVDASVETGFYRLRKP